MSPASCMPGGSVGWPASLRAAGASWQLEATALRTHAPVDSGIAVSYCRATAMAAAVLAAAPIVRVMLLMPSQVPISRHLMHAAAGVQGVAHLQVSGDSQALAMLLGFRRRSCLWCWHSGPPDPVAGKSQRLHACGTAGSVDTDHPRHRGRGRPDQGGQRILPQLPAAAADGQARHPHHPCVRPWPPANPRSTAILRSGMVQPVFREHKYKVNSPVTSFVTASERSSLVPTLPPRALLACQVGVWLLGRVQGLCGIADIVPEERWQPFHHACGLLVWGLAYANHATWALRAVQVVTNDRCI